MRVSSSYLGRKLGKRRGVHACLVNDLGDGGGGDDDCEEVPDGLSDRYAGGHRSAPRFEGHR